MVSFRTLGGKTYSLMALYCLRKYEIERRLSQIIEFSGIANF